MNMNPPLLSRRDFLKLSGAGLLSMALAEMGFGRAQAAPPTSQGRVPWSGVPLQSEPRLAAPEVKRFGIDQVVDLQAEVEGDAGYGNPFNTTWFQLDGGYVYSGWLQPVETKYNKPVYDIPAAGKLGEITVPMSLTYLEPFFYSKTAHRIFYETTHWIKRVVVTRIEKSVWYEIYDKVFQKSFYVPAQNMRIIPDEELTQLSPQVPAAEKEIHVDLASQMVMAFESGKNVFAQRCASGLDGTNTPAGEFSTYHKGPSIHMTNDQGDAVVKNTYSLAGVPWCSFFTGLGHAFHGTYWHNDFGRPRSHGCVNLPSSASKWLYRWCNPLVPAGTDYVNLPGQGTKVIIA